MNNNKARFVWIPLLVLLAANWLRLLVRGI